MRDPITPQINAALEQQRIEHGQREYEQRRNHEYSLGIEYYRLERQRIERTIYFVAAIPLATIAISDFQIFPKLVFLLALVLSFFAYAFWFINEFHGGHWRIDDAQQRADLWFRFATVEDQERLKEERKQRLSEYDPNREADHTAKYVAGLLLGSFLSSVFAFLDELVDVPRLPTPNHFSFAIVISIIGIVLAGIWIFEFHKILKVGEPS
jgi:cytochrome b subunit of formate dehydrogenase